MGSTTEGDEFGSHVLNRRLPGELGVGRERGFAASLVGGAVERQQSQAPISAGVRPDMTRCATSVGRAVRGA